MPRRKKIDVILEAMRDARVAKWIESKAAGRDLGTGFIRKWFHDHWRRWCRFRWYEHVTGRKRYEEFDEKVFGVIKVMEGHDQRLVDAVLRDLADLGENLPIIHKTPLKDIDKVKAILKDFDINDARYVANDVEIDACMLAWEEADKYKWIESQNAGQDLGPEYLMKWIQEHGQEFISRMYPSSDD